MIRASICSNNGPCGSTTLLADKAKFTVFVRNHQWSSARHVQETLQEFAQVIEKNARKLGFIKQDDRVERLQLARSADGMEPEELDVDATLEDVLICMGTKQLVALITSSNPSTEWPTHADDATDTNHLPAGKQVSDSFTGANKDDAIFDKKLPTAGSYSLATPISTHSFREELLLHRTLDSNRPITSESPMIGTKPTNSEPLVCSQMSIASSNLTTSHDYPHAGAFKRLLHTESLHIRIPNPDSDRIESPTCLVDLTHQTPAPISSTFPQRILLPSTNHPSFTAPSPAELAQFLVKTSTNPPAQYFNTSLNTGVSNLFLNNTSRLINEALSLPNPPALASQHSFQPLPTLAPAGWLSDSVKPINAASPIIAAEHDTLKFPTPNIAILAQFLATQLGAFVPTESNQSTSAPAMINDEILHPSGHKSALQCSIIQPLQHHCKETLYPNDPADLANTDNYQNPGCEQDSEHCIIESRPEKDQSSSSVIDANPNASSQPEMVFLVNRRSKTGTGTHRLKMSELSSYFHLSVVDAAKKLGVSQTTLKKACRKFGLKRWPGRKVRSLESTIHGLEHTIAVGQGAGMEELTEAQIRSELSKLQQEMDHLVHGLPSMQQPTALRTADLYKRLYSRGWKSKYHDPTECGDCTDGNDHAAGQNSHQTSAFTSCDVNRYSEVMNPTEGLSNSQASSVYPKLDDSDQEIALNEPEDDGQHSPKDNKGGSNRATETIHDTNCQSSPATNKAKEYTHDTSCQQVMSLTTAARTKRKRKFRDSADNPEICTNANHRKWSDDPWHVVADANAATTILSPPQNPRPFHDKIKSEGHLEKISENYHLRHHYFHRYAHSPEKGCKVTKCAF